MSDDRRVLLSHHRVIIAGALQFSGPIKQSARRNIALHGGSWRPKPHTENVLHVASENSNFRPPDTSNAAQVIPEFPCVLPESVRVRSSSLTLPMGLFSRATGRSAGKQFSYCAMAM